VLHVLKQSGQIFFQQKQETLAYRGGRSARKIEGLHFYYRLLINVLQILCKAEFAACFMLVSYLMYCSNPEDGDNMFLRKVS
jgi:hypothetical protein